MAVVMVDSVSTPVATCLTFCQFCRLWPFWSTATGTHSSWSVLYVVNTWAMCIVSGTILIAFRTAGQEVTFQDCTGNSGTVGKYAKVQNYLSYFSSESNFKSS